MLGLFMRFWVIWAFIGIRRQNVFCTECAVRERSGLSRNEKTLKSFERCDSLQILRIYIRLASKQRASMIKP